MVQPPVATLAAPRNSRAVPANSNRALPPAQAPDPATHQNIPGPRSGNCSVSIKTRYSSFLSTSPLAQNALIAITNPAIQLPNLWALLTELAGAQGFQCERAALAAALLLNNTINNDVDMEGRSNDNGTRRSAERDLRDLILGFVQQTEWRKDGFFDGRRGAVYDY